jgi:amidase
MSNQTDTLMTRSALDLARMVRDGEVSARELVEAALRRIEARKDLNAFTYVDAEAALAAADAVRPGDARPFAGVPTAIKELNATAGQPMTMGSDLFGNFRPTYDAYTVRRLRDAGFILVGRTSAPEFGIVPVTEPRRFGATRNPWDLGRTPGGSSGGAAAAVAGGVLPLAQGSDGAGSLRIPAACCGLVGLKPSRGRISRGPELGDDFLSTDGVLTRTVAETAQLLDLLAGYEIGDATWAPPPLEPFTVEGSRPPRRLRVAWTTVSPLGTPVDPVCAGAVQSAARVLESLGHAVEEATPPGWQAPEMQPSFMAQWGGGIATGVRFGASVTQRDPAPELVEPLTWNFYQLGTTLSAGDYAGAKVQLQAYARRLVAFFNAYDIMMMPALAQRPVRIGEIDTCSDDPWGAFQRAALFTPFTPIWNLTGQPAMSLPLYQGADGLPLAVQFAGPPLGEGLLLSLATQLEAALPWAGRRAPGV